MEGLLWVRTVAWSEVGGALRIAISVTACGEKSMEKMDHWNIAALDDGLYGVI